MRKLLLLMLAMGCNSSKLHNLDKKIEDGQVTSLQNASAQALVDSIFVKDEKGNYVLEDKDRRIVNFDKVKNLLELIKTNENNKQIKDNLLRTLYATKNDILELLIRHEDMDLIKLFTEVDKEIDFDTIKKRKNEILALIDGESNYMEVIAKQNIDINFITIFLATNTNREFIISEQTIRVIYILSVDSLSDEQVAKWIEFIHFRGCTNINYEIKYEININEIGTIALNEMLMLTNRHKAFQTLIKCGYDFDFNYSDEMITGDVCGAKMLISFINSISGSIIKDHKSNNIMHRNVKDENGIEIINKQISDSKRKVVELCKERNEKGLTSVDYAIALGKSDILELMLKEGIIEIDQQNCLGMTPLMFATIMDQVKCMEVCLLNGASIEKKANNVNTPALIKNFSLPFLAVIFDNKDSMVFALEQMDRGIDIVLEESQMDGKSPLTVSCMFRSINCFNKLIKMGANINHDSNPLYNALSSNFVNGIKILIEKGANINYEIEGQYESPIIMAISYFNKETFDLAIDKIDDIDEGSRGYTPLMTAVTRDIEYFINKLIEKGANINAKVQVNNIHQGMTPLMIAVLNKSISAITILLEQDNIDLSIELSGREAENLEEMNEKYNLTNDQTALDIAKANSYKEAIKLIEAKMAKI